MFSFVVEVLIYIKGWVGLGGVGKWCALASGVVGPRQKNAAFPRKVGI
jgi:hypothetical protein